MYKALKSFTGKIRMQKGQVADIKDKEIIDDLLNAGYIAEEKVANATEKIKEEIKKEVTKVEEKLVKNTKKNKSKK